jgi:hypothetical protein
LRAALTRRTIAAVVAEEWAAVVAEEWAVAEALRHIWVVAAAVQVLAVVQLDTLAAAEVPVRQ